MKSHLFVPFFFCRAGAEFWRRLNPLSWGEQACFSGRKPQGARRLGLYLLRGGMAFCCLLAIFLLSGLPHAAMGAEGGELTAFTHFSLVLPPQWSGEEQRGFISDNPGEYVLTLGRRAGDEFLAQVSIYLLPNKPGATAGAAARILTQSQGEATEPVQEGDFWVFWEQPRTNVVKGRPRTMVNADSQNLLIIIAQDEGNLGASEIIRSLRGRTGEARRLLGR